MKLIIKIHNNNNIYLPKTLQTVDDFLHFGRNKQQLANIEMYDFYKNRMEKLRGSLHYLFSVFLCVCFLLYWILCLTNDRLICTIEREENCIASLDQDHFIALTLSLTTLIHWQFNTHAAQPYSNVKTQSLWRCIGVCVLCLYVHREKEMERVNSCAHLLVWNTELNAFKDSSYWKF